MSALDAARAAARKAHEALYYDGLCTIIEYSDTKDETTGITSQGESAILEDQPCHLSFESISTASQTDTGATISQSLKLFLAPEIEVKPGCKIVVTQNGETGEYKQSGVPAVYAGHQEIMLDLFEEWA